MSGESWKRWWEQHSPREVEREVVLALAVVVAGEFVVLLGPYGHVLSREQRFVIMGPLALPCVLSLILALGMGVLAAAKEGLRLHIHHDDAHSAFAEAVHKSWNYERDRYRRALSRAQLYASAFGVIASLFLVCSELLLLEWWRNSSHQPWGGKVPGLALAIMAATVTAFLLSFAKVIVRLSGYDFSARAFSWTTRSLVFSVVAAAGLLLALPITDAWNALLVGILAGVGGEHAMHLLLEKAPKILSLTPTYRQQGPSPLLAIEGITPEHVDRLEEEGVLSIHDLALAPTARLFFNTPYGLPMICDWQDQALLLVRVGQDRARDLFNQLGIRGAIDLHRTVRDLVATPSSDKASRDALQRAMRLDKEAPLEPMLKAIEGDEAILRVALQRRSVVREPAQIDPAWSSDSEDLQEQECDFTCVPVNDQHLVPHGPH